MLQLPFRAKHERLLARIKEPEGYSVELKLSIDGVDLSERLGAGSRRIEEDTNPTISLDTTLDGFLDTNLFGGPVRFWADIEGDEIDLLNGSLSMPTPIPGFETGLIAASPGALLTKVRMRPNNPTKNLTEYNGWLPHRVVQDAVYRCAGVGGYDRGQVRVEHFDAPVLHYKDDSGFEDESRPMDVLEAVTSEIALLYRDTPTRGFEGISDPLTGEGSEVVWDYDAGNSEVFEWLPPALASPDDQYSEVVVRDRTESGSYRVYESAPVNHHSLPYPPFEGQTLFIPVTDETSEAARNARQIAVDNARSLSSPAYQASPLVAFNPFLQKGDVVRFSEDHRDQRGLFRRQWRAVIVSTEDPFDLYSIATQLSLRLYLTKETRISDPVVLLPGVMAGAVSAGVGASPYGEDGTGDWIDPERILSDPPWGGEDATGDWVDLDLAPALLGEDVTGEYIEY